MAVISDLFRVKHPKIVKAHFNSWLHRDCGLIKSDSWHAPSFRPFSSNIHFKHLQQGHGNRETLPSPTAARLALVRRITAARASKVPSKPHLANSRALANCFTYLGQLAIFPSCCRIVRFVMRSRQSHQGVSLDLSFHASLHHEVLDLLKHKQQP
ncbi:hypothetical protein EJ05DRAFT_480266 [Pseudovirgaria hyperparasitica]|uniref:Uncharacterized protein n=1 Tax=Pseudovirgaria hyperparasitica TaxID=470096 RepID=A0A6A6VVI8_9PEZI|nr:uncharacterized protein EJ05DRAFT_480266 [Pseudovirgaria hyperparasitica]KAF2753806.1 hypothetical protein EJ05DRAFT_480266 [Pseudovirgaria hyperparasitica]